MNIRDFKAHIDRICSSLREDELDSYKVVIPVQVVGSAGGTPYVEVKNVANGFDWDRGKIMLHADAKLRETNRDELKSLQKSADEIGWSVYEFNNLKRENKRLLKELNELKGQSNV